MSEISKAIKQICEEKGLSEEDVINTIELALAAAYRKDFLDKSKPYNIRAKYDFATNQSKIFDVKTVVEDLTEEELEKIKLQEDGELLADEEVRKVNPKTDIEFSEAQKIDKKYKVGDEIITELEVPTAYGRMAAQTAKQVIIQKLREAEREAIYSEFKDKENEVVNAIVQRVEGRRVLIDIGKAVGFLPREEQILGEPYKTGARIKVFIKEVRLGSRGAEIILSRTSEEILKKIFYLEIPEIANGLVELKSIAREAGSRSKVAVLASTDRIDPVGACVGQKGARIQTIISELGGEKIDIIIWDEDPQVYIANALAPAKILDIKIKSEDEVIVRVASDQLSLAIGKHGQNVRLAARLTGWKIDIVEAGGESVVKTIEDAEVMSKEKNTSSELEDKESTEEEKEEKIKEQDVEKIEKETSESEEEETVEDVKANKKDKENVENVEAKEDEVQKDEKSVKENESEDLKKEEK